MLSAAKNNLLNLRKWSSTVLKLMPICLAMTFVAHAFVQA
jgi:hypothetical protein